MMSVIQSLMSRQRVAFVAAVAILVFVSSTQVHAQQALKETAKSSTYIVKENEGTVAEPQAGIYAARRSLNPKLSRVTFYRPAQGFSAGVASISINGRFHAALQLAGFNEICLEPGTFEITAHMNQTGGELKNSKEDTATLKPRSGEELYVRVFEYGDGRATVTQVREDVALPELKDVRRQLHAVSRFAAGKSCFIDDLRQGEKVEAITKESVVLGTDALFAFDRGDIDGMTPQGRASLTQLIVGLQKRYGTDKGVMIHVTGHADPLGSPLFNQRLSEARAFAVRRFMIEGGISPKQMTIEGRGSEQPVINTCAKTATPESIQCNKPNRRVVVVVQESSR